MSFAGLSEIRRYINQYITGKTVGESIGLLQEGDIIGIDISNAKINAHFSGEDFVKRREAYVALAQTIFVDM